MSLEIRRREREGITILDLSGRITAGQEVQVLRDELAAVAADGVREVILNLGGIEYIDSTGLGALVMCFTSLRNLDGKLKLENLNRRNIELLVFTKLTTVFEIFNEELDAVNSFFPDRQIKRFDILSFVREQTGQ
jgi:anti-sigma B factor antagonist